MEIKFTKMPHLLNDMQIRDWENDTFQLEFNGVRCVVLLSLLMEDEVITHKHILAKRDHLKVKLQFIEPNNITNRITAYADFYECLFEDNVKFYDFFNVEGGDKNSEIFKHFDEVLAAVMPSVKEIVKKDEVERQVLLRELAPLEEDKIYCYDAYATGHVHNGEWRKRSTKNSNKAALLRPELYATLKSDPHLSFFFSDDPNRECSDEEIQAKIDHRCNHPRHRVSH